MSWTNRGIARGPGIDQPPEVTPFGRQQSCLVGGQLAVISAHPLGRDAFTHYYDLESRSWKRSNIPDPRIVSTLSQFDGSLNMGGTAVFLDCKSNDAEIKVITLEVATRKLNVQSIQPTPEERKTQVFRSKPFVPKSRAAQVEVDEPIFPQPMERSVLCKPNRPLLACCPFSALYGQTSGRTIFYFGQKLALYSLTLNDDDSVTLKKESTIDPLHNESGLLPGVWGQFYAGERMLAFPESRPGAVHDHFKYVFELDMRERTAAVRTTSGAVPAERTSYVAAVAHGHLFLAGGMLSNGQTEAALYVLNLTTWRWSRHALTSPSAAHIFLAAYDSRLFYDPKRHELLCYGAYVGDSISNQLFTLRLMDLGVFELLVSAAEELVQIKDQSALLQSGEGADIDVLPSDAGPSDPAIRAHRGVLAESCPRLATEAGARELRLAYPRAVVAFFLRYLYGARSIEGAETPVVASLLELAERYGLEDLRHRACVVIRDRLDVDSAGLAFRASLRGNAPELRGLVLHFIFRNFGAFYRSKGHAELAGDPEALQAFVAAMPATAVLVEPFEAVAAAGAGAGAAPGSKGAPSTFTSPLALSANDSQLGRPIPSACGKGADCCNGSKKGCGSKKSCGRR
eukprot:tig00000581_g2229.t1